MIGSCLYLIGLRADRIHAGRAVTEPRHELVQSAADRRGSVTTYRGLTASQWAARFRHRTRQLQAARAQVRHVERTWRPTVTYALTLASAVFGVPYSDLAAVSHCESTWNPFAVEPGGTYKGLFQLGWRPFGLNPFDPIANALSAAQTVRHDGSWRQWQCKP